MLIYNIDSSFQSLDNWQQQLQTLTEHHIPALYQLFRLLRYVHQSQCTFQPLTLESAYPYHNLLTVWNAVDVLCESIQILIGWQYTYWPGFKGSQLCVALSLTAMGQSSVAPSPVCNKSSHFYNTVVCTSFGRQTILPAYCFTCCDFPKFLQSQTWEIYTMNWCDL